MRLTKDEATKLMTNLENTVLPHASPEHLLLNWLRDNQGEAIQFYTESTVMDWKERNPLVQAD